MLEEAKLIEGAPCEIRRFEDKNQRVIFVYQPVNFSHPKLYGIVNVRMDAPIPGVEPIQFVELLEILVTDPHWTCGASDIVSGIPILVSLAFDKYDAVLADNQPQIERKAKMMFALREKARAGIAPWIVDAAGLPVGKKGR